MAAAGAAAAAPPVYTAHFAAGNNPTAWFGLPATSPLALAIGDVLVTVGTNAQQRRVPWACMEALVFAVAVRDDSETLGTMEQRLKKACITRVINYLFGAWNPPLGTTYVTTLVAAQRAVRPLLPRAPPPGPDPLALRASDFEALSQAVSDEQRDAEVGKLMEGIRFDDLLDVDRKAGSLVILLLGPRFHDTTRDSPETKSNCVCLLKASLVTLLGDDFDDDQVKSLSAAEIGGEVLSFMRDSAPPDYVSVRTPPTPAGLRHTRTTSHAAPLLARPRDRRGDVARVEVRTLPGVPHCPPPSP